MTFDLEMILPMEELRYCEMVGKDLSDYIPKGVHFNVEYDDGNESISKFIKSFAKLVPEGTEAVVNYQVSCCADGNGYASFFARGLALIPKDYKDGSEKKQSDQDK